MANVPALPEPVVLSMLPEKILPPPVATTAIVPSAARLTDPAVTTLVKVVVPVDEIVIVPLAPTLTVLEKVALVFAARVID